jgi:uncharacterized membrane protein
MSRPDPRFHEPTLRIGDADRDDAIGRLSEHYAAGRLDKDEFDERSDAVWSARTGADLAPIFADLEPARPRRAPAGAPFGPWGRRGWFPLPFVPVLFVLIALTVVTHVPFVLFAFLGWMLFFGPWRRGYRRRYGRSMSRPAALR